MHRFRVLFLLLALLGLVPVLWGQTALQQLEDLAGKKIEDVPVPTPEPQPDPGASAPASKVAPVHKGATSQQLQMAGMLGDMLGDMFVKALFPSSSSDPAAAAEAERQWREAKEAQERALKAWADAYSRQMNDLLNRQRQQRSRQDQESLENLSSALSGPWDGRRGSTSNLTSVLSDPAPMIDLSGSRSLTPGLLRDENGALRTKEVTPDELLKRREEAQARLKAMMEEDQDANKLGKRLYELEDKFKQLKQQAGCLGEKGRDTIDDYQRWGRQVDEATQNAMERGTSMVTGSLLSKGTAVGMAKLQSDPATWNETMESFSRLNKFTEFATGIGDRYDDARETLDWVKAKRNAYNDMDFIASHLSKVAPEFSSASAVWGLGKNIVGSSMDIAKELDGWGNMNETAGDQSLIRVRQQQVKIRMTELAQQLQYSRSVLAAKLNVHPEDLIPVEARQVVPLPTLCAGQ